MILIRFGSTETENSSSMSSGEFSETVSLESSVVKTVSPSAFSSSPAVSTELETVASVTNLSSPGSIVIPTSAARASEVVDSLVVVSVGAAVNMFGIVIPRKLVEREGAFVWSASTSSSSSKSIPNSSDGSLLLKGVLSVVLGVGFSTIGLMVLLGKTKKGVVAPSRRSWVVPCLVGVVPS